MSSSLPPRPVTRSTHPLVQAGLTRLRDVQTSSEEFRRHVREVSMILFIEAARELETHTVPVTTSLDSTTGQVLSRRIVLVPILRAGLGMVDGIWPVVPSARLAHIGIYRDEVTAEPHPYYSKFGADLEEAEVFVLDPMLATGQTAVEALRQLKTRGVRRLAFICLVAAPEGLAVLQAAHPEVPVFTATVDARLNDQSYIVPGLGDAGDRYFGTAGEESVGAAEGCGPPVASDLLNL